MERRRGGEKTQAGCTYVSFNAEIHPCAAQDRRRSEIRKLASTDCVTGYRCTQNSLLHSSSLRSRSSRHRCRVHISPLVLALCGRNDQGERK
eukprot:3828156-Rhodomonas_salina.3